MPVLYDTAIVHALPSILSTAYPSGGIVNVTWSNLITRGWSKGVMLEQEVVLL